MKDSAIYTVSALTSSIKQALESNFPFVWVRGQVVNLSRPSSGHVYFSLKDEYTSLAAVWFKGNQKIEELFDPLTGEVFEGVPKESLAQTLKNGQEIICAGRLTVYGARGVYQLIVELAQNEGVGRLHEEFERLKEKLALLGYFALERKRLLPSNPEKIAIITAPTGAAVHDFLRIADSRGSGSKLHIYPAPMQGTGAAFEIRNQLSRIEREGWAEVIVLIRGGGSLEDLWEFNNEELATAIKNSVIPVIAGIGHEVDFTLSDMTADVRAATPTHAAQLLWPDRRELYTTVERYHSRLNKIVTSFFLYNDQRLDDTTRHIEAYSPIRKLAGWAAQLHSNSARLSLSIERSLQQRAFLVTKTSAFFSIFSEYLGEKEKMLETCNQKIIRNKEQTFLKKEHLLETLLLRLEGVNPLSPLDRGYALVHDKKGNLVRTIKNVHHDDRLFITLGEGVIDTRVEGVKNTSQSEQR